MAKPTNTFALGLTVIVMLALFFGTLVFIGGSDLFGPARNAYAVRFPASSPLPDEIAAGAPVFCGLLEVGSVDRVSHEIERGADDRPDRLFVRLDIRVDKLVPLRSDCRIVARGPLLGGGGKLVIVDPGLHGQPVTPGAVIDGMPGSTFDAALDTLAGELDPHNPAGLVALVKTELDAGNARSVMAKIHRSVEDLNLITTSLARQMDARDREALLAKLGQILDHVNEATGSLRDELTVQSEEVVLGKLHKGLDTLNADLEAVLAVIQDNRPHIDGTLAGLRRTVDTVEHGIATPLAEQLDVTSDTSLLSKLHVSFDRLNQSLADLTVVTGETRQVLVLNKERLNDIFANVNETSAHLKAASKEIRRSPWRLLYRPSLEETRELNIFDASREFATAAAHLDDSATQLRALLDAYGGQVAADDPELLAIKARLQETFTRFTEAESTLWKELSAR